MAIEVKADIKNGADLTWSTHEIKGVRVFQVTGLEQYADSAILVAALMQPGIPAMGSGHPAMPTVPAVSYHPINRGAGTVDVRVEYVLDFTPTTYLQSFSGSFKQIPNTIYSFGQDVSTIPTSPDVLSQITFTPLGGRATTKNASLTLSVLSANLTFEVVEQTSPETLTAEYAGFTNSDTFRGYLPRTVLCLPICGSTRDGTNYRNRYSFAYNPQTWDQYDVVKNADWTVPVGVAGIVTDGSAFSGNGWGRFMMHGTTAFGTAFPKFAGAASSNPFPGIIG